MAAVANNLHIDGVLSEMAMGYRPEGFIADMIFPVVQVAKQSDLYVIFSREDRLRRKETRRAPGADANRIDEDVSSASYFAKNYALKAFLTQEDMVNADPIYREGLVEGRTQLVLDGLLLDWEIRVANLVTSGSNVGSYAGVSSAWNGAGDPITDLNTALDNVHDVTGVRPNRIVFGLDAWRSFRRDSTVRNLIFGVNNGGGYPNAGQAAALLDVDEIFVGGAFQNTVEEGQSESLSKIWGDNVLVYYAPNAPTRERPSLGYAFRWADGGLPNMQVERHPFDSKTKSSEIEVGYYQDEVLTGTEYGFLLAAVNSST